ncbi:MAG: nitronate monooxygenase [Pseudomonadota bacterium]|nr:nitronate monooxygenase [Pseudomonadota bacterium]
MAITDELRARLRIPVISAPMFLVSGPALVIAACRAGVIGSFPTANCRTTEELDRWMTEIGTALDGGHAPVAPNLIVHRTNPRVADDLAVLARHRPELVIASVGSPAGITDAVRGWGGQVWADVASMRHAEKAIQAGADGLILLTGGAGGQTGWANPFAFARGVRDIFDGPMVLAGGVADGRAVAAAEVLGFDLCYMGTRFIATAESMAKPAYKEMLVGARLDDVMLTDRVTGLPTSMLVPSLLAAGLDPKNLPARESIEIAKDINPDAPRRWRDVWSAGHSVEQVHDIPDVASLVADLRADWIAARQAPFATG